MSSKTIYVPICRKATEDRIINLLNQNVKPSYVYSIKDITNGKRYVGVRTAQVRKEADPRLDLGAEYLSSTSNNELYNRIKNNREEFVLFILGVFHDSNSARRLEDEILKKHCVYTNESFYNISTNNSHRDTTGLVPVKTESGNVLISKEEFDVGGFESTSSGTLTMYDKTLECYVRVTYEDWNLDKNRYDSHYSDTISVLDVRTNSWVMISCSEYYDNKEYYKRNTSGMVAVKNPDLSSKKKHILVTSEEFSSGTYESSCSGTISARLRNNPTKFLRITTEEYNAHPELYMNPAEGVVYAKFKDSGELITVTTEEYQNNKDIYCLRHCAKTKVYDMSTKTFASKQTSDLTEMDIISRSVIFKITNNETGKTYWVKLKSFRCEIAKLKLPSNVLNNSLYVIEKFKNPSIDVFHNYHDFWVNEGR